MYFFTDSANLGFEEVDYERIRQWIYDIIS